MQAHAPVQQRENAESIQTLREWFPLAAEETKRLWLMAGDEYNINYQDPRGTKDLVERKRREYSNKKALTKLKEARYTHEQIVRRGEIFNEIMEEK